MHCAHCVRAVEDIIKKMNWISESLVSIGSVEITSTGDWSEEKLLIDALEIEGFRVSDIAVST